MLNLVLSVVELDLSHKQVRCGFNLLRPGLVSDSRKDKCMSINTVLYLSRARNRVGNMICYHGRVQRGAQQA